MLKAVDLREKSSEDLKKQLLDLRKAQFNLRFQKANLQLEKTAEVRKNRRDIARLKTVIREKESA